MSIRINIPVFLNAIGKRSNNEDSIYPMEYLEPTNVFLVCDGVGGEEKGEVASRIVAREMHTMLHGKEIVNSDQIIEALRSVEAIIQDYLSMNPDSNGMATTLTFLAVNSNAVVIAHAGDSRIYQFRENRIVYRTRDHSFVSELIEQNLLTEEEAKVHPKRNVITKAITGINSPIIPSVTSITDIQKGDRFLLCTDGITESFSDQELSEVFNSQNSLSIIQDQIAQKCQQHSKDNYSMIAIEIQNAA